MGLTNVNFYDANKNIPKNSYASILRSNITNNDTNFSQNSQPSTSTQGNNFAKFIFNPHTNTSRPNKRQKPNSPDPTDIARKEIISVVSPPKHSEGIVKSQFYQQNLNVADSQSEELDSSVINVILESVLTIVNSIKQNNNFNISKSDVIQLISNHFNQNLTSNHLLKDITKHLSLFNWRQLERDQLYREVKSSWILRQSDRFETLKYGLR
uniref:Uncharacterized protein LOC114338628 n=1 Tax=Diabrotica virgifera virgifera TaxID=50390 RepID=A0A6P7GMK5_DIAVI